MTQALSLSRFLNSRQISQLLAVHPWTYFHVVAYTAYTLHTGTLHVVDTAHFIHSLLYIHASDLRLRQNQKMHYNVIAS